MFGIINPPTVQKMYSVIHFNSVYNIIRLYIYSSPVFSSFIFKHELWEHEKEREKNRISDIH